MKLERKNRVKVRHPTQKTITPNCVSFLYKLYQITKLISKHKGYIFPHIRIQVLYSNPTRKRSYLSLEMMLVLKNSIVISVHTDSITKHLFLVVKESVSAEVIGKISSFIHRSIAATAICTARHSPSLSQLKVFLTRRERMRVVSLFRAKAVRFLVWLWPLFVAK